MVLLGIRLPRLSSSRISLIVFTPSKLVIFVLRVVISRVPNMVVLSIFPIFSILLIKLVVCFT